MRAVPPPKDGINAEQRPTGQWHFDQFGSPQRGAQLAQEMFIESRSTSGRYSRKEENT